MPCVGVASGNIITVMATVVDREVEHGYTVATAGILRKKDRRIGRRCVSIAMPSV